MGLRLGNVPTSTLDGTDNIIFAEGEAPRKALYSEVKKDIVGESTLTTTAQKPLEAVNELNQDLLEATGYGVVSGGMVSAQSTPNMTVNVTACVLKTATGARQIPVANNSLAVTVADTTNPRIDIVYINSSGVVSYLQGTAAAGPTVPATPTGGTLLAQISVVAGATSITNANITDKRKMLISTDALNTQLSDKAQNTDNARTTIDKTVTGAINELNSGKVNKTSIVNNLTTTIDGTILDGKQGKILDDKITAMNKAFGRLGFTGGTLAPSITGTVGLTESTHNANVTVANNTVTINKTGFYSFSAYIPISVGASGQSVEFVLINNSNSFIYGVSKLQTSNNDYLTLNFNYIGMLSAGDVLKFTIKHSYTSNATVASGMCDISTL